MVDLHLEIEGKTGSYNPGVPRKLGHIINQSILDTCGVNCPLTSDQERLIYGSIMGVFAAVENQGVDSIIRRFSGDIPKHENIPEVLFDGYRVFKEMDKKFSGPEHIEIVSEVLDAVVRLIRGESKHDE